jgi:prepilin-type N-terminal cleavage/methylation domain-containing protein/prepilin-type processing-associated H-X9-DG protein
MRRTARRRAHRALSRTGLTLLELLVVIGIIAVLVAALSPALSAARRQSRVAQCQSNIRHLAVGLIGYANDSNSRFPPNANWPSPQFWCDEDRIGRFVPVPRGSEPGVFACPEDEGAKRSYAMNVWASSRVDPPVLNPPQKGRLWNYTVARPSQMVLLIEAWSFQGSLSTGFVCRQTVGGSGTPAQRFGAAGGLPPLKTRWGFVNCDVTYALHRARGDSSRAVTEPTGRSMVAFADGHVELLRNDELANPVAGTLTGAGYWSPSDWPR